VVLGSQSDDADGHRLRIHIQWVLDSSKLTDFASLIELEFQNNNFLLIKQVQLLQQWDHDLGQLLPFLSGKQVRKQFLAGRGANEIKLCHQFEMQERVQHVSCSTHIVTWVF
jgi:hypothetical protein